MLFIELLLIGISLSIDAFSLAVSLGINNKINKDIKLYSLLVGVFHFFMPIIGFILRRIINNIILLPNKLIFSVVIISVIIGILIEKKSNKTYINPILFAFSVSLDSFTIGISLHKSNLLLASFIFSIVSSTCTYLGFKIANKIKTKIDSNLKIISITLLLIILVYNILI